jgi:hypothetical protein
VKYSYYFVTCKSIEVRSLLCVWLQCLGGDSDSFNVQISISNSRGRGGKRRLWKRSEGRRRRRRIGNGRAKRRRRRRRRLSEMEVGATSGVVLGFFGRFTRIGRMKG